MGDFIFIFYSYILGLYFISLTYLYGIWDCLCAHYNVSPVKLQSNCDGCGTTFGVTHALSCSIGGLVIACHNKIRDKFLYLSWRAFTSASVHVEHRINQVRTRSKQEIRQGSDKGKETRGGVMVWGLWDRQVNAIIDVNLGYAGADTYKYEPMK